MQRKSLEPWISDDVHYYDHQIEGIRELSKRRSFLLADEMGLGKSLQAITVFAIDVVRGWSKTALIVCPVTLKANWSDEFEKFTRIPCTVLEGTAVQRSLAISEFASAEGPRVMVVNYEQVVGHLAELQAINFDTGIFDEAHYLKNPKAKRTKACVALKFRRVFLLTGTPMLNQVDELWTLLHMIDSRRYPRFWSFVNRYAVFGGYQSKQIIGVKNERELTESLQDVMLRRLKKDVLDLPEIQFIERKVELHPEQRRLYDQVFEEMMLERHDSDAPDDIENALTKFLRLKQICGTTYPFTGVDVSSKLDLAIEDSIELLKNGHKIIVFTQFRDVLEQYCVRLDKAAPEFDIWELHGGVKQEDRQPAVKEWSNSTKPGAIVCMLQVAGVGLNMTAGRHVLFLDKLFVPGLNQQAIDRAHRIGQSQSQSVQVYEYLCRGTIESRVNQILKSKKKLFGTIVEQDPNWKKKLLPALMDDDDD